MSYKIFALILGTALLSGNPVFAQSASQQKMHPVLELAKRKARTEQTYSTQYAFEMTYSDEDLEAHAFVNPTWPEGMRLDVVKPGSSDWDNDFRQMLTEIDAAPYEEFWCTDFLKLVGTDVKLVVEDSNTVTFAFTPQPGPDDDADDRKFLAEMIAHLTIGLSDGAIKKFEMRNRRPFRPIFIAKIKSFRMEAKCEMAPDGRFYVADLSTDLSAKIALKKTEEHERRSIFNLTRPRQIHEIAGK